MDPYASPWKKYLPSRRITIAIGVIGVTAAVVFGLPAIIRMIKNHRDGTSGNAPRLGIVDRMTGDPTARDSDGDTIPDWQEIALGLNPNSRETAPGVPDRSVYEKLKTDFGETIFADAAAETTDLDKLSFTIAGAINQGLSARGDASVPETTTAASQEIINYINAKRADFKIYTRKDLHINAGTLADNQAYASAMRAALADNPAIDSAQKNLPGYLDGTVAKSVIEPGMAYTKKTVDALLKIPVPPAAAMIHLEIINALSGLYQTVNSFDPATTDDVSKLGTASLAQDYAIAFARSTADLTIYFSVALNPGGYIKP